MNNKTLKQSIFFNSIKQICMLIFPLITMPYVTRTLGTGGYGKYVFATSYISYFAYIASFGVATYGVRECSKIKDKPKQLNILFSELLNINLLFTVISYVLLFISIVCVQKLHNYSLLIIMYSISIGLTTVGADWINTVFEEYEYITIRYIVIQIIAMILMFALVKTSDDVVNYCIISLFASAGGNLLNIGYIRRRVRYTFKSGLNISKHFKSLLIFFISSLGILIYVNSDITMLGMFLNDKDVGIYSFGSKLYGMLKTVVYSIISTSAARMAYLIKKDNDEYYRYMDKIFTLIILILFPLCVGSIMLNKNIIAVIGGFEYLNGSDILIVLISTLPFAIMCSYFSSLILIINNQERIMLISTMISAISNIILNLLFIPLYGALGAAFTTLIAEFISFSISFVSARKFFDYKKINLKTFYAVIMECLAIVLICFITNIWMSPNTKYYDMSKILICVLLSGFSYIIILLNSRDTSIKELIDPFLLKIRNQIKTKE